MKPLLFHIPVAWKRYPFQVEPPRKGHHSEYPHRPPPPLGALHSSLIMWVWFPGAETIFRSSFTLQAARPTHGSHDHIKWHSHNSVPQYYFHAKYFDAQFLSAWTTETYTDSVTEIYSKNRTNAETGSIGYILQGRYKGCTAKRIMMSSFFKDLLLFTNGVMIVSINVSMRFATWSSLLPVNVNYKMLLTV